MTDSDCDRIASQVLNALAEIGSEAGSELVSGIIGKTMFMLNYYSLAQELSDDIKNGSAAKTAIEALDLGNCAMCMAISGQVVYVSNGLSGCVYIADSKYDLEKLYYRTRAYNAYTGKDLTPAALIEHYVNRDKVFQDYYDWWFNKSGEDKTATYRDLIEYSLEKQGVTDIDDATPAQFNKADEEVNEAIHETGSYKVEIIEKYIDDHNK